ncbi:MAG: LON peptidase substrate-binding domain-containing protein [Bacteriodetes bacterium]|nr:LON peptidase substrate-binding domain-containing protein [Bacteroidota bacterium]
MAEMIEKIPLFPLSIVLFPGSFYPLHIFEDKYKELINTCIQESTYFGINLVNSNKMFNVGCTAKVAKVLVKFDDGRMDIMISGGRRYALQTLHEQEKTYLTAHVEYFDDNDTTPIDPQLFDECVEMYNKVMEVIYNGEGELFLQHTYAGEANLSFLMAQKAGLQANQKQDLLEMRSENERLTYLHTHLSGVIPRIKEAEQIQKLISMDGYFRP